MTLPPRSPGSPFGALCPDPFAPAPRDAAIHRLLADHGSLLPPWPTPGVVFANEILREAGGSLTGPVLRAAGLARSLPGTFCREAGVTAYDERGFGLTGEGEADNLTGTNVTVQTPDQKP